MDADLVMASCRGCQPLVAVVSPRFIIQRLFFQTRCLAMCSALLEYFLDGHSWAVDRCRDTNSARLTCGMGHAFRSIWSAAGPILIWSDALR